MNMEVTKTNESQSLMTAQNWEKIVSDYLFANSLNMQETTKALFYQLAKTWQLDPFKRELHPLKFWNREKQADDYEFVTGYQVYIRKAQETGNLDGYECCSIREGKTLTGAKVTIYRKDWSHPFIWTISINEFIKYNKEGKPAGNWGKMPEFMIQKTALSQAFRLAFPEALGGMPYTAEEMQDGETERPAPRDVTPPAQKTAKKTTTQPPAETLDHAIEELKAVLTRIGSAISEADALNAHKVLDAYDHKDARLQVVNVRNAIKFYTETYPEDKFPKQETPNNIPGFETEEATK